MTLGDAVASELPFLRAQVESTMVDTGAAWNPDGQAPNPRTNVLERGWVETSDTGPCKVQGAQGRDVASRSVEIGGVARVVVEAGLHRPISAPLLLVGWEWRITAVGDQSDPSLIGRRFRIVGSPAKSWATARRYDVVEITWERDVP